MAEQCMGGQSAGGFAPRPVAGRLPGEGQVLLGVDVARLRNGLTLVVKKDDRFPKALFRLEVKAGSSWESPEEYGVSHLIEHMAFAAGDDGADMYERAEQAGGTVWANTSRDYTTFYAEMPAVRWKEALRLLHRLVFEMPLSQGVLDAEREIVVAELREYASLADRVLFDLTLEAMFQGTPYQNGITGTEDSLDGITIAMVRDYMARRYVPRDMVLSVVGNVDTSSLLEEADALFGGYAARAALAPSPAVPAAMFRRGLSVQVREMPMFGAWVCLAFPLPFVRPGIAAGLALLAELLDGSEAALLKRRLCFETGAARHVQVSDESFERAGAFLIEAFVGEDGVEACLRELSSILDSLDDSQFSDEQIALACARLADGNMRSLERAEFIAELISNENLHASASACGWMPLSTYRGIGREQLRQAMELCFRSGAAAVTVVAGDAGGLPMPQEEGLRAALQAGWPGFGKEAEQGSGLSAAPARQELIELGGGCSLAVLPDASLPFMAASLCFSGGEALAAEERVRGMEVLARILPLGMQGRTRQETAKWLYERSASFQASRSVNDFSLSLSAPARFMPELFAFLKEAVERPVLHKEDFEREKELVRFEDDRMLRYFQMGRGFLLKDGPYRSAVWPDDPADMSLGELERLWEAQRKRPWTLCVAGDVDRDAVAAFAHTLPRPTEAETAVPAPEWEEFSSFASGCEDEEQAAYALMFRAPGEGSPDRPAMELLLRCLNGGGGLLYRAMRQERQLCYSAEALDWCEAGAGLAGIFVLTAPEALDAAAEALGDVIQRLCEEELPEEELARGRAAAESLMSARMQGLAGRAFETARRIRQGGGMDFARQWSEAIQCVTAAQLREAARRWLILEEAAELSVEPGGGEFADI